jgi:hypothetical protein
LRESDLPDERVADADDRLAPPNANVSVSSTNVSARSPGVRLVPQTLFEADHLVFDPNAWAVDRRLRIQAVVDQSGDNLHAPALVVPQLFRRVLVSMNRLRNRIQRREQVPPTAKRIMRLSDPQVPIGGLHARRGHALAEGRDREE